MWDTKLQTKDEQHQIKRMAILRVAAKAFNQNGFDQTSVTKLAAQLNVTKPTLYYYVENKDDILEGILELAAEQLREMIQSIDQLDSNGMQKLRRFMLDYSQIVTDDFGACLILMRINAPNEKFRKPYNDISREVFVAIRQILTAGIEDGSIGQCNPKYMASALLGTMNETVYWHLAEGRESPLDASESFLSVFERGLEPRRS